MQESEAKRFFEKLKIRTLLDLALILPARYEDTRLSSALEANNRLHTFEAEVLGSEEGRGQFRVNFRLLAFSRNLTGVFFRATAYHRHLFRLGSRHVIQGRLSLYRGAWQMAQPRSLKEFGTILPRYKTPLKEHEFKALLRTYLTQESLKREGLLEEEAASLIRLHFPMSESPPPSEEKNRKVLKFVEAFNHLKKLRRKRKEYPALKALKGDLHPFLTALPFDLTADQHKVIEVISQDLERSDRAARRMILGDVGSGKTIVILAAAAMAGKDRSLLMAPTGILARQLYEEACKFLSKTLKIALLSQGEEEGDCSQADLIIGTHALLYREELPSAALVMVDEQHRFGTRQRAMLESLVSEGERRPHYLQFSATPIPRTQAMMESELIDVSLIRQTPFKKNIHSQVVGKSDFPALMRRIEEEIQGGHQILIVYPLVEASKEIPYQSIDEARNFWEKRYEGVYVTHGRDKEKENVLMEFRQRGRILLATTVIEVGISLPRLTTVVIVGAERLGLATLHQLRGRVGRNGLESYCYLYTRLERSERLESFCRTQSGFEIARLDLEYRDSGDLLEGTIQSGQKFRWLDLAKDEEVVAQAKARLKHISP